jgi:hypothetical protein
VARSLDRVVVFVGAGVSEPAGLPGFGQLRTELFAGVTGWRFLGPRARRRMKEHLAVLAPEYAVSLLDGDSEATREYICQRLSRATPGTEHNLLAAAMKSGSTVFTPNFDMLIEQAAGPSVRVAVRSAVGNSPGDAQLLKLHGTCPEILVSAEEVLSAIPQPWAERFINDCSRPGTHLLVWGYKGADPDLAPLVIEGAKAADNCTWIAFCLEDEAAARSLLANVANASVRCANGETSIARRFAADILDPDARVRWDTNEGERDDGGQSTYQIKRRATRAKAVGHIGGVRLGRRALWLVLASGDSEAARPLVRSYLFDSRLIQLIVLASLPALAVRRPTVDRWNAVLTAAEGRGVRSRNDEIIDQFESILQKRSENEIRINLEVRARHVSLLRGRGRLENAQKALDWLEEEIRERGGYVSATWKGRLLYERALILRLQGNVDLAFQLLGSLDTEVSVVVGANWSMWLEDEKCALAIWREEVSVAEEHLRRSRELASAYGDHRLARVDLDIRSLQLELLENHSLQTVLKNVRAVELSTLRRGLLTPVRRVWLNGIRADGARRNSRPDLAIRYYRRLRSSPHLVHQLASVVGVMVCGAPLPHIDMGKVIAASGPSMTVDALRLLDSQQVIANVDAEQWVERLKAGKGFAFLS